MVCVISLASCLWLWFQSVYPLMPFLSTYPLTWVYLTLDVGYVFTAAPAKHSHCSLSWMWGSSSWLPPLNLDVGYFLSATLCHHEAAASAAILEKAEKPEIKLPTFTGSSKKQESSRKTSTFAYWLCQSLWLCGSQQTVENSERDGNTRPPYLPPEKSVRRSRSNI